MLTPDPTSNPTSNPRPSPTSVSAHLHTLRASALALTLALFAAPACEQKPEPAQQTEPAKPARVDSYPGIKAEVVEVLDQVPGKPRAAKLHHVRIPTFVHEDGRAMKGGGKPGMKPMTMRFVEGPGIDFSTLKPGDKVEFDLRVEWAKKMDQESLVVTALRPLPADTALDFEDVPLGTP